MTDRLLRAIALNLIQGCSDCRGRGQFKTWSEDSTGYLREITVTCERCAGLRATLDADGVLDSENVAG